MVVVKLTMNPVREEKRTELIPGEELEARSPIGVVRSGGSKVPAGGVADCELRGRRCRVLLQRCCQQSCHQHRRHAIPLPSHPIIIIVIIVIVRQFSLAPFHLE